MIQSNLPLKKMVENQLIPRGIDDPAVIQAFLNVDRARFVPKSQAGLQYADTPLPIGLNQTISQPFIVAYMTQLLKIASHHKILEIGTGSGYQTALLCYLAGQVYSIERLEQLQKAAEERLQTELENNLRLKTGDGTRGWPEFAPFDRIIITAAAADNDVLQPLFDQLSEGGRMISPVGTSIQKIYLFTKKNHRIKSMVLLNVRFVPLISRPQ